MSKAPPPKGGVAGVVLLFCFTAAAVGLGFDLMVRSPGGFWVGAQPGAAAVIGAGAAALCVIAGRLAQILFGKRGGDAGGHS